MYSIPQLQEIINKAVEKQKYPAIPKELYDPISYIMSLGGKRMRPVLVLIACNLFTDDIEKAIDPALAIEVFHNFTLMHDDIMDKAPIRRGQPTVHTKWNPNVAILSGDVMFVEAYKLMIKVDDIILRDILAIFSDTASAVCEGQQIDMNFEDISHVSIDEYLKMIEQKTAALLAGGMKIGALIGGADKIQADLIYDFALNLGIAFQLQDDILDVYGDPEKFGKQVGGDITANKKTFLLITAKELASEKLGNILVQELANPSESKVEAVKEIYNQLNIRKISEDKMDFFAGKALSSLDKISIPEDKKTILRAFAGKLMQRES